MRAHTHPLALAFSTYAFALLLQGCFGNSLGVNEIPAFEREQQYIQRVVLEKKCDFGALVVDAGLYKDRVIIRVYRSGPGRRIGDTYPSPHLAVFCIHKADLTAGWLQYEVDSRASWPVQEKLPYRRGTVFKIKISERNYNLNSEMNPQPVYDIYMYGDPILSPDTASTKPPRP